MREILFKAKRVDNGEWVEGYYYKMSETTYCFKEDYERKPVPEHHYILQERMTDWGLPNQMVQIEIIPETLCQFTGLCDRYGNKIWENDILKMRSDEYAQVKFGLYNTGFVIGNYNQGFYAAFSEDSYYRHELGYWCKESYVRGNTFDNPELLQEKLDE
ncbi:MAG: YopX family protein [Lachnospiraceae bacterium]|nr:YopX family protein [Lachnospiraceae bacterium]